jgi:hypothetical protein
MFSSVVTRKSHESERADTWIFTRSGNPLKKFDSLEKKESAERIRMVFIHVPEFSISILTLSPLKRYKKFLAAI